MALLTQSTRKKRNRIQIPLSTLPLPKTSLTWWMKDRVRTLAYFNCSEVMFTSYLHYLYCSNFTTKITNLFNRISDSTFGTWFCI